MLRDKVPLILDGGHPSLLRQRLQAIDLDDSISLLMSTGALIVFEIDDLECSTRVGSAIDRRILFGSRSMTSD